jgi:hypothetical protein
MFEWLKDKLAAGWQSSEIAKGAEQLAQFETLEKLPGAKPALASEGELTSVSEAFVPGRVALGGVLTELNSRLLAIAETGAQQGLANHRQWFSQSTGEAYALGLTALARSLSSLAHESSTAAVVLRTRYLTYLHGQATSHLFH